MLQQRVRFIGVSRINRQAYVRAHGNNMFVHLEGLGQFPQYLVGGQDAVPFIHDLRQYHGIFMVAYTHDAVLFPAGIGEAVSQLLHQGFDIAITEQRA